MEPILRFGGEDCNPISEEASWHSEPASSTASVGESMIEVQSAAITDTGRRRPSNEDALLCDDRIKLYLVADGLGGHRAGAVASTLAVKTIRECMEEYENIRCRKTWRPSKTISPSPQQVALEHPSSQSRGE